MTDDASSFLPHSPATERNKGPILDALKRLLPPAGAALEIASGTGQHAAHFARGLPCWRWQPSEAEAALRPAIEARCKALDNVPPPLAIDVTADAASWPAAAGAFDAVFCANLLHIAPWAACPGLMRGAARCLAPHGVLIVYGPCLEDGVPTAPGNLAFDADLRRRDPAWGVRRLADVAAEARAVGLALRERVEMPANNLLLAFGRG